MGFVKGQWRYVPVPNFRTKEEAVKYWIREEKRWIDGYDGMCGMFYKYLTQYKILNRTTGEIAPPDYRQVDHEEVFPLIEQTLSDNKDFLGFTQRGFAKSTIFGGFVPIETAIRFPNSTTIITADTMDNIKVVFEEKIKTQYEQLHDHIRPKMSAKWPAFSNKTMPVIQFQNKVRNKNGVGYISEGLGSIIRGIDTEAQDGGAKVEGKGAKLLLLDEIFKKKFAASTLSKGRALVRDGMRKKGSIFMVGSLSDASADGLSTAIKLWEDADKLGINKMFISSARVNTEYQLYDSNGNLTNNYVSVLNSNGKIDVEKGRECILNTRKELAKLSDPTILIEYILQYPLEVDELLSVNTDSWWSPEIIAKQREQRKIVEVAVKKKDYRECEMPSLVYRDRENNIKHEILENASQANVFLFRLPQPNTTYGFGSDPIPGTTQNKAGSDWITTIKNFDTNQYDGYLVSRAYDLEPIINQLILLQEWYNNAQNLIEKNTIGAALAIYRQKNALHLLAKTPKRFRAKTLRQVDFGLNKDANTSSLHQMVTSYVNANIYTIFSERFHKEFLDFPYKNTDYMSAMAMCEALHEDYNSKPVKTIPIQRQEMIIVTDAQGRRVKQMTGATPFTANGGWDFSQM
jgi:hypothetical protein